MPKVRWSIEIPHLLLIVSMFTIAAAVWPSLPDRLPFHWTGLPPAIPMHVDGYAGKAAALLTWPIATVALYALLLFAPLWSDEDESRGSTIGFSLMRMTVTAFMAVQNFTFVLYYEGYGVNLEFVDRTALVVFGSIGLAAFIWQLIRPHLSS